VHLECLADAVTNFKAGHRGRDVDRGCFRDLRKKFPRLPAHGQTRRSSCPWTRISRPATRRPCSDSSGTTGTSTKVTPINTSTLCAHSITPRFISTTSQILYLRTCVLVAPPRLPRRTQGCSLMFSISSSCIFFWPDIFSRVLSPWVQPTQTLRHQYTFPYLSK
jgi:hypothetical protein